MRTPFAPHALTLAILAASYPAFAQEAVDANNDEEVVVEQATGEAYAQLETVVVLGTAEEELKQALGTSTITAKDIQKRPVNNDISEIVRKMPGVNLTGNGSSGSRGNNRQIDLRGMGPENTLILIDGKPVTSRNAVRYGRSGERDTRGDSNWVPADQVESIEVLRGPAAARYGSGSMGGVVNIITKRPTEEIKGSVNAYWAEPEDKREGVAKRTNFSLSGPLTENVAFRVFGGVSKTDADDADINVDAAQKEGGTLTAGREGVRNRDISGLLSWKMDERQTLEFESSFSRQGNIYAGDTGSGATTVTQPNTIYNKLYGRETNTMYRETYSITHKGDWDFGSSRILAQYEKTRNYRFQEGLSGSGDGNIASGDEKKYMSTYDSYLLQGQLDTPFEWGVQHVLTTGFEAKKQRLNDPSTLNRSVGGTAPLPNSAAGTRSTVMTQEMQAAFVEDNIELTPEWILTPGLRVDHHDQFGIHWSPSLNTSYAITDTIKLKGGIARAFKAPNLYQSNPNYLYFTRSNGCPTPSTTATGGCYVLGNENLEPEISINKEIGISFADRGWTAGWTYFRNDYDNKIRSGDVLQGYSGTGQTPATTGRIYQWENAKDAIVKGVEGFITVPLLGEDGETLKWSTNVTRMYMNEDDKGEPLSIVPRYTINTMLDWNITEQASLNVTGTFYGKQEPRQTAQSTGRALTGDALRDREPYQIWAIGGRYQVTDALSFGAGVNNLFDKRLHREGNGTNQGANTYNEPGRLFYVSANYEF